MIIESKLLIPKDIGSKGNQFKRQSGTEPLIRIMVEAKSKELCRKYVNEVMAVLKIKCHVNGL